MVHSPDSVYIWHKPERQQLQLQPIPCLELMRPITVKSTVEHTTRQQVVTEESGAVEEMHQVDLKATVEQVV
jgi:hypothetical protein